LFVFFPDWWVLHSRLVFIIISSTFIVVVVSLTCHKNRSLGQVPVTVAVPRVKSWGGWIRGVWWSGGCRA